MNQEQELAIFNLPIELLKYACSFLDFKDAIACRFTSRQMREGSGIKTLKNGIGEKLIKPIPFRFGK